jgi:hypothetical protein
VPGTATRIRSGGTPSASTRRACEGAGHDDSPAHAEGRTLELLQPEALVVRKTGFVGQWMMHEAEKPQSRGHGGRHLRERRDGQPVDEDPGTAGEAGEDGLQG